jgi:hypothetical protein
VRGTWSFPSDFDPLLGKDQKKDDPNLVEYKAGEYSVWNELSPSIQKELPNLNLVLPKCYLLVEKGKVSDSRRSAVWVILCEPVSCTYSKININDAVAQYYVTVQF